VKIRVTYQHCRQIGPYDYQMVPRVLDVSPETTVGEILAWHDVTDPKDATPVVTLVVERSPAPQEGTEPTGRER
jgi:hypothetical protein